MEQTTTTTLAGSINKDNLFLVDFAKCSSVEDLVLIFASMGLSFSGHHPHFDTIKHLLDLTNPIVVPQQPRQPLETELRLPKEEMKLPKLKQVK